MLFYDLGCFDNCCVIEFDFPPGKNNYFFAKVGWFDLGVTENDYVNLYRSVARFNNICRPVVFPYFRVVGSPFVLKIGHSVFSGECFFFAKVG